MKNEKVTKKCKFGDKLQKYDQFGQQFNLMIDEGRGVLPSKMGTFCSIFLLILMIIFTGYKISVLQGKKSIDIVQAVKEKHFDASYVFGADQGFNIAVAVFNPMIPSTFQPIDPAYGRIRFLKTTRTENAEGHF